MLRWGKRSEDEGKEEYVRLYREKVLESRPIREAPFR